MFLSAADLRTLTGRTRPRAQAQALARMGIRFALDADGRPQVLAAEVERAMLGTARRREPSVRVSVL